MKSLYCDIIIKNWTYKQETAFMCAVPYMISKVEDNRIYFSPLFFPQLKIILEGRCTALLIL